eukprot:7143171-Ditylum_brightwellii.AAC.1
MENDDEDDDSTYVPNEEGSEKDDSASIPSIDSLQEAPICHNIDDFEPLLILLILLITLLLRTITMMSQQE